jgi:GNAT superfamily N-acetyltransferase
MRPTGEPHPDQRPRPLGSRLDIDAQTPSAWDDEREEVIGGGHAIPAAWDGDTASLPDGGFDAVIEARFAPEPPTPSVLCALGITIAPECRGRGLSRRMIERMAEFGRAQSLDTLIAPVRPP